MKKPSVPKIGSETRAEVNTRVRSHIRQNPELLKKLFGGKKNFENIKLAFLRRIKGETYKEIQIETGIPERTMRAYIDKVKEEIYPDHPSRIKRIEKILYDLDAQGFTTTEEKITRLYIHERKYQVEIAEILNVSQQYVSKVWRRNHPQKREYLSSIRDLFFRRNYRGR